MWWDWSQITLLDSVLFSIVSLFILFFVGYGVLRLISIVAKKPDPFNSFDSLQKMNLRIFFGFTFVFLFVYLFSFFNVPFLFSSLAVIALAVVGLVIKPSRLKSEWSSSHNFRDIFVMGVLLIMLLSVLIFSSTIIAGQYGGTNDDAALHSVIVRVLLNNPNALWTRSSVPFGDFVLDYPSGAHVLSAFFVSLLGVSIQKIIMLVGAFMPALIALAFYSSTKSLFKSRLLAVLSLFLSGFFGIVSTWFPVSWGGLPLLISLYLSITILGIFYIFIYKDKVNWFSAFLIGLVFFITSETYPDALFVGIVWFFVLSVLKFSQRVKRNSNNHLSFFNKRNVIKMVAVLVPILLAAPYAYSIYTSHVLNVQFSQLNNENASIVESVIESASFTWFFNLPAFSLYFSELGKIFSLVPFSLILLVLLFIPFAYKRLRLVSPSLGEFRHSFLLIYALLVIIMSFLTVVLFFRVNFFITLLNPRRLLQHVFVPGVILSAIIIFIAISSTFFAFKWILSCRIKLSVRNLGLNKVFAGLFLIVVVSGASFVAIPVLEDRQSSFRLINQSYDSFEMLDWADVSLIGWINDYIGWNVVILVSMGDSGQYLMPMTGRQTVSSLNYFGDYGALMWFLTSNASDLRAIRFLIQYKVNYVYIGSLAANYSLYNPTYRHFNATEFLSTPYFSLENRVGDAWLFYFNATKALDSYFAYGVTS
jgi:hypothetical protein